MIFGPTRNAKPGDTVLATVDGQPVLARMVARDTGDVAVIRIGEPINEKSPAAKPGKFSIAIES